VRYRFVASASFHAVLSDADVAVQLDCRLLSATAGAAAGGASKVASVSVLCEPEPVVTATVFVDASYDGDVMVAVGDVAYTAGRESVAQSRFATRCASDGL
jgi:hypothetical protein